MSTQRGKRYTSEQRREFLELYRQSGYSAARFCREMGLSYPTLRRWLGEAEPAAGPGFVEVEPAGGACSLGVGLPGGLRLDFGPGADPSEVRRWIRELRSC